MLATDKLLDLRKTKVVSHATLKYDDYKPEPVEAPVKKKVSFEECCPIYELFVILWVGVCVKS